MRRSRHILIASLLAASVGATVAAHAQQSPQSDSGRIADTAARHATPVISGLATTVSSKNAPDAVSVVTVSDTTRPPAAAFETLLDGQVPGVTIESSTSDVPGEGPQLRMRGVTALNGTDAPLYVVNGVMVISNLGRDNVGNVGTTAGNGSTAEGNGANRIVDIDPSDIASIEILKGPSATAIYGAEGGAGVVIITTKQGTPGTTHWDLNGAVGHYSLANEVPTRQFPTLASAQAWYVNDATHDTTAATISADNAFIQSIYAGPQDYQAQLFGNSQVSFTTSVSANGTIAATQYYFSALSRYDNGVMLNTGDARQSVRGTLTQHVGSTLSLTGTVNYVGDVTRQGTITDGVLANPYTVMSYTPAFVDLDRESTSGKWTVNPFGPSNPFADENGDIRARSDASPYRGRQRRVDALAHRAPKLSSRRVWWRRSHGSTGRAGRPASRLALTAGVTAQSSTLNGNTGEFFPYPHYAASYRILHPWSVLDEIKLRAAYGVSGNLSADGLKYVPYNPGIADGTGGISAPQPLTIKPTAVRETELGFDMPMFAGRAQLSATVYDKRVSDVLLEASSSNGYGEYVFDDGAFKDQGAELELQATPVQLRNGFAWTTTTTFARSYSAVGAMPVPPFETALGTYIATGRSVSEIVNTNFTTASGLPVQVGDYLPGYEMSFSDAVSFHHFRVFGLADWSRGATATDLLSSYFDFGSLVADSALAARYVAAVTAGREPGVESASYFTLRQVVVSYSVPEGCRPACGVRSACERTVGAHWLQSLVDVQFQRARSSSC